MIPFSHPTLYNYMMLSAAPRVLIIGAGLAGLACARRLTQSGIACTVLEGSDDVGGRVRTDRVEGFQLDRGFQVFLTGYPEARQTLDYPSLDLRFFHTGAVIRYAGRFHRISDPLRRPQDIVQTLLSPIGSLADKFRMLRLRRDALEHRLCSEVGGPSRSTLDVLQAYGFSAEIQTRFFLPFLRGVFLEQALSTPCWIFELVWAAFSRGEVALPRDGMGAIAHQLAAALPAGTIRLRALVNRIEGTSIMLESGERLPGDALVIATDYITAARLRGESPPSGASREATCLYFDAPAPPIRGPWLIVNGDAEGPVRTLCVLSEAAPSYAPPGRALVSISLSDRLDRADDDLPQTVRRSLRAWFGPLVDTWRHLRTDRILGALPPVDVLPTRDGGASPRMTAGLYLCGDYCETGTFDGALLSGRKAADALRADHAARPTGVSA
ncbi:MAG: NAD(P)/FAD-dependent oxidoreductase [Nitrospirota bacterium]|nr:NAD(P)/FAD-dependent oxidoreductase [Nitrospirota bacterium]